MKLTIWNEFGNKLDDLKLFCQKKKKEILIFKLLSTFDINKYKYYTFRLLKISIDIITPSP